MVDVAGGEELCVKAGGGGWVSMVGVVTMLGIALSYTSTVWVSAGASYIVGMGEGSDLFEGVPISGESEE